MNVQKRWSQDPINYFRAGLDMATTKTMYLNYGSDEPIEK